MYWAVGGSVDLHAIGVNTGPYWGEYKQVPGTGLKATAFNAYGTANDLALSYNILPFAYGWPTDQSDVTIPAFTVYVYAVSDGSFDNPQSVWREAGSYYIDDPADLTATYSNGAYQNQKTLELPASCARRHRDASAGQ